VAGHPQTNTWVCPFGCASVSGVHENNREIGRHAADLLFSLVMRNERGIPAIRQTILVEPSLDPGVSPT